MVNNIEISKEIKKENLLVKFLHTKFFFKFVYRNIKTIS